MLESGKLDGCGTVLWVVGRSGGLELSGVHYELEHLSSRKLLACRRLDSNGHMTTGLLPGLALGWILIVIIASADM